MARGQFPGHVPGRVGELLYLDYIKSQSLNAEVSGKPFQHELKTNHKDKDQIYGHHELIQNGLGSVGPGTMPCLCTPVS